MDKSKPIKPVSQSYFALGIFVTILSSLVFGLDDVSGQTALERQQRAHLMKLMKFQSFGYENYKAQNYQDAVRNFWKLVELDTLGKFPSTFRYLGDSYFKMEKTDSAKSVYQLGIEKYPNDWYLHYRVGHLLSGAKQIESAIEEYEAVTALIEAERESDLNQLGLITKDFNFKQISQTAFPTRILSKGLLHDEHYETIITLMETQLKESSTNLTILTEDLKGRGVFEEHQTAVSLIEQFELKSYSHKTNILLRNLKALAGLYLTAGRKDDAIAAYKHVLSIDPDDLEAKNNLAALVASDFF